MSLFVFSVSSDLELPCETVRLPHERVVKAVEKVTTLLSELVGGALTIHIEMRQTAPQWVNNLSYFVPKS